MFAHQVIGDMKKISSNENYKLFQKTAKTLPALIMNSNKFHVGEMRDIVSYFKRDAGKPLFEEHKEYLRMPFKICWFDYLNNYYRETPKGGMIVLEVSSNKWMVWMFAYIAEDKMWMPKLLSYHVDFSDTCQQLSCYAIEDTPAESIKQLRKEDNAELTLLQSAILLLNTKNIITEEHHPPEKLNKKRRQLGRQELFTYKTLNVVLPSPSRSSSGSSKTDIHQRIHLCRGHFKEYTTENPLFGKHTGLYWWQPHVRGQNKDGIVMKEYEIEKRKND